ncbi:hypothetical protein ACFW34_01225 [Streptomyces sp. NPDC058848]|uniref:hypothetical protein n=1 Tax=unclassified Streptomyces TaxID=2593676 RepID=UPI0036934662
MRSTARRTRGVDAVLTSGRTTTRDLRREVRWFTAEPLLSNQQLIDAAYGFGFDWVPGVKPRL